MELDFSPLLDSWQYLLGGLGVTLLLSMLTAVGSLVLGTALGLGRVYGPAWLRIPIVFYIDTQRAILTLHIAAYVAEIVRAGIESIRPGQVRAALALGMSRAQVVRKVVLPQAMVRMLPSFGSILSVTIKDTAIAAVIAVPELMKRAETIAGQSYRPIEVFTTVMVIYFIILFPGSRLIDRLYQRIAHLGRS
jgi:polar amino acid transport system permease protein